MRLMLALISLGLLGAAVAQDYRQWDEEKLREELGRIADATRKINVPMRDGVHLSTDVYLPKDSHIALPTVFSYGRRSLTKYGSSLRQVTQEVP